MSQMSSSGWLLAFIISLLLSLLMGLALVWLSIERTDKAYSIRQLRNEVEQRAVLKTKLEVERDRLLAPHAEKRKQICFFTLMLCFKNWIINRKGTKKSADICLIF